MADLANNTLKDRSGALKELEEAYPHAVIYVE
jgi:hypothetical protein